MDTPEEQEKEMVIEDVTLIVADKALEDILDEVTAELNHLKLRYEFLIAMANRITSMPFFVNNEEPEKIKKKIIELTYYADFINAKLTKVDWDE